MIRTQDLEMGIIGGISMAAAIFLINLTGGAQKAMIAAFVQAAYSFCAITLTTSICRNTCTKSAFKGIILPTLVTTVLTYAAHAIAKSPEPFWSAAFAFITALPSFALQTWRFRKTPETLTAIAKRKLRKS